MRQYNLTLQQPKGARSVARAIERIRRASDPVYHSLFTQITQTMGGMRFLVAMRADLLVCRLGITFLHS